MKVALLAFAIALFASPLHAGEWTGSYAGGQAGMRNAKIGTDGGEAVFGLHGGYEIDFGDLVLGGEFEYENFHLIESASGEHLSNVGRLKLRAGRDFGATMAYAILGGVNGDTNRGSETGVVYGLGLVTEIGDHMTLSGEALRQEFNDFGNFGRDLKTDSFNVRVSFRF